MLVDTDVIIWYLRGHESAAEFLDEGGRFAISVVTYIELVQGMRNQQELRELRAQLRRWQTPILPIVETISHRAAFYVERHFLSDSLRLADALIAATAIEHGMALGTGNVKHYKPLKELELKRYLQSP